MEKVRGEKGDLDFRCIVFLCGDVAWQEWQLKHNPLRSVHNMMRRLRRGSGFNYVSNPRLPLIVSGVRLRFDWNWIQGWG
jgi:hypothetical protein